MNGLVFVDYIDMTALYITICIMRSNWLILNLNSQMAELWEQNTFQLLIWDTGFGDKGRIMEVWLSCYPVLLSTDSKTRSHMTTSSNGDIFRVTGHLCVEFTGPRWIPHTKASDAELWCFLWSASELTVELTMVRLVIWDAMAPIMPSP